MHGWENMTMTGSNATGGVSNYDHLNWCSGQNRSTLMPNATIIKQEPLDDNYALAAAAAAAVAAKSATNNMCETTSNSSPQSMDSIESAASQAIYYPQQMMTIQHHTTQSAFKQQQQHHQHQQTAAAHLQKRLKLSAASFNHPLTPPGAVALPTNSNMITSHLHQQLHHLANNNNNNSPITPCRLAPPMMSNGSSSSGGSVVNFSDTDAVAALQHHLLPSSAPSTLMDDTPPKSPKQHPAIDQITPEKGALVHVADVAAAAGGDTDADMKDTNSNSCDDIRSIESGDDDDIRTPKVNSHGKVKTHRCKQCDFVAVTKLAYWDHTKEHIKPEKRITCPKCPFVTEFKHHMEYHLRNHNGSKPFRCNQCNYTCVNKSMLNSHLKSHSDIYQYRCRDCSYATKYCHSLKLHLRKYTHRAAMVLNQDGSPNPLPIIDVYGTRRGPKSRKNGHSNARAAAVIEKESKLVEIQQQQPMVQQKHLEHFQQLQHHQQQQQQQQQQHQLQQSQQSVAQQQMLALQMIPYLNFIANQRQQLVAAAQLDEEHHNVSGDEQQMDSIDMESNDRLRIDGLDLSLAHYHAQRHSSQQSTPMRPSCYPETVGNNGDRYITSTNDSVDRPPKTMNDDDTTTTTPSTSKNRRKGRAYKLDMMEDDAQQQASAADDADNDASSAGRRSTGGDGQKSPASVAAATTTTMSPTPPAPATSPQSPTTTKSDESISRESKVAAASRTPTHEEKESGRWCNHCRIIFMDDLMHTVHMGYHGFNDVFTCNMCGTKCDSPMSFFLHMARYSHT